MADSVGVVERLWRYPVKSTGGERLRSVEVDGRGLVGDRLYAVRDADGKFGSGKNTRRFRRMDGLLHLGSRYPDGGREPGLPELTDPHGRPVADPTAYLRAYLGRDDVELAREGEVSHFDQLPLSVLTTATLDWIRREVPGVPVDERRFRPNILVRTPPGTPPFVEDTWIGRRARLGDTLRVEFVRSSERCAMTNQAQRDLPHSPLILRAIATAHDNRLDALATVLTPGTARTGETVLLERA
ncbi:MULTISPECIES: MOSC domain-containing protein [unclassified Streptomyces]|uniref:MOSC domain-containing protein n=1 Tax=unclassified Streptomyces TaxID=2593676 RepID=UPI001BE9910F|nr:MULTISPECIES: MOSC N-terminal beta barrel domain-containing protein [unclassified Streptomyces]MBT2407469.1 MOSC N-terminal beta barrel domain-containing protein [Streptomyces sp. ISL-21]MBT2455251.1 MOSC N-terminal beta barrel domain-containing protein [Streptomyces sp. ISL-86]MBT2609140.1 MOSC N-terminal beta barrel domain-containing protein [Streptomyces sp. ISL-87]